MIFAGLSITRIPAIKIVIFAALAMLIARPSSAQEVNVFAAASLRNVLNEIAQEWHASTGHRAVVTLAGSSALARQIQHGAPADIFISANASWMDELEKRRLIDTDTRVDIAGNHLVLISHGRPDRRQRTLELGQLPSVLGDRRLAMGLVDAVPAGIYGKAALKSLGIWSAVNDRVAQADNVRAALTLVAAGEAPLGIVYATDADASDNVTVVATFPPQSHPSIRYPAAAVRNSTTPNRHAFLAFLISDTARETFSRYGFAAAP